MTLQEILVRTGIEWPKGADYCYQSVIDSEIYFKNDYGQIVKRVRKNPIAEDKYRGDHNRLYRRRFMNYQDELLTTKPDSIPDFFKRMIESGGPTKMKIDQRERMIQRIENGLRKDFDIDSRELAVVMFERGWRK